MNVKPPGWYPDPENAPSTLRWWDGNQWTSATQTGGPGQQLTDPTPQTAPKRKGWKIVGGIVGGLVVLSIIGNMIGGEDDPAESEAVLTTSTAIPLATSAPARTAESSSVVAAPSSGALAPTVADASGLSDARCASASPSLIAQIARGLTDNSLTLANGLVIEDGPYTFVGATMLRPDGQMENRSDVWVVLGGKVYASTGGARNETSWPKASSNIDISPGDERVQALDQCVIDVTTH
ncbi:DUF2510 domain-containing protein [Prescottella equi]|uniref:DUF2510 domain-containing protein n=1 Tax=Rhodococcus hoagii TaxID=43767 RepID=UPI001F5BA09A|nr:DUF2510 domain-containing protein [Prescottella equi]UNQ41313.1 DUF2510 domain-containing protein [Prescottella equi]